MLGKINNYSLLLVALSINLSHVNAHSDAPHISEPNTAVAIKKTDEERLQRTGEAFEIVVVINPISLSKWSEDIFSRR